MLSFGFLVFVFGAVCGSLEPQPGEAEGRELLHCNDRLNHIERFLSRQEILNREVYEEGAQQNSLIRHQQNLIRELNAKLSRQEILIGRQEDNYNNLLSELSKLRLQLRREEQDWYRGNENADGSPTAATRQRERTHTAHDVGMRSDDSSPMEAVVTQLSQKVTEIQALQTRSDADIRTLNADVRDARTSTFVQWGSSTCAANSTLIYSGVVGGSDFQSGRAAANYLCLTLSPVLLTTSSGNGAHLVGGEYETNDSHQDKDPVCAVCRSAFAATVMIPGTNVCTPGWHVQYSGYLMAGYSGHAAASEYVCVDSKLESLVGSGDSHNGKLLYYVRTQCGSLPCEPYVNDRLVTCVVCSK